MQSVNKAYEITDARISFVSLVDKAANLRKFLITKAADGRASFTTCGRIIRKDAENHYVTGIVYEPLAEDAHGNYMTEEEITKAAYWYAENGNHVDLQHSFQPLDGAAVVENWVAKADYKIGDEEVRKGTWLMTIKVTDGEVWKGIEDGEITGLSMGGIGNYSEEDVKVENVSKEQQPSEKKGLLKQLGEALGFRVVEKGAVAEVFAERSRGELFWQAFYSLQDVLQHYDPYTGKWQYETDEARVRECLEDFSAIITEIFSSGETIEKAVQTARPEQIAKAGKKMSGKNRETLCGIYESLGTFLKEFDDPEPEEDDPDKKKEGEPQEPEDGDEGKTEVKKQEENHMTKQEVEQIVKAALEKAAGQNGALSAQGGAGAPEAAPVAKSTAPQEITAEGIESMVQAAVAKALAPQPEQITAEQVQAMITTAVEKAVEPVLKSRGLPSNLNDSGSSVQKAVEPHYLHGIL